MRVLISAGWLGGAGGAERALHSLVRALPHDRVDVVARQVLGGPFAEVHEQVTVHNLLDWRWRAAARDRGLKGRAIQQGLNPLRRRLLPTYDVYVQLLNGGNVGPTVRAKTRLLVPSGQHVKSELAQRYDAVALQAPDNGRFVPSGARTVLLPPPLFDLSELSEGPAKELPEKFYLTVFNPYDPVKGADDLARALETTPHPIVWCHSNQTLDWSVPDGLANHPQLIHVDDPTPAQMRNLYETCLAYLSFSKTEGFGWSTADALRYSPAVVSRPIGIMSFPEAVGSGVHLVDGEWSVDWRALPERVSPPQRDLDFVSPSRFRNRLLELMRSPTGTA